MSLLTFACVSVFIFNCFEPSQPSSYPPNSHNIFVTLPTHTTRSKTLGLPPNDIKIRRMKKQQKTSETIMRGVNDTYDSVDAMDDRDDSCDSSSSPPPAPSFSSITTPTDPSCAASAPSAPSVPQAPIPMSQLKQEFSDEWINTLNNKNNADVFALETHQGKVRDRNGLDSTNGCSVIAPLIATAHVRSSGGVSDDAIAQIIDNIAPQLLHVIRAKLGLGPNSLIIPSDVHDHLFDKKIISPESFVGARGGNVMSDEHIGNMLDCLNNDGGGKGQRKSACAFFFHAHVVCIVKLVVNGGKDIWYDLIDSLPHLVGNVNEGTRTRCKDVESLRTHLRWYASSKFGPADCDYIDENEWNDASAELDPRVFQAFTWACGAGSHPSVAMSDDDNLNSSNSDSGTTPICSSR